MPAPIRLYGIAVETERLALTAVQHARKRRADRQRRGVTP